MQKPYRLAVRAVVEDEKGRSLVLRRSAAHRLAGTWEWPGGKVDDGEDFETALRREVREETGLEIELGSVIGAYDFAMDDVRIAMLVLSASLVGGELEISDEHDDAAWLTISELLDTDLVPGLRAMVDIYAKRLQTR